MINVVLIVLARILLGVLLQDLDDLAPTATRYINVEFTIGYGDLGIPFVTNCLAGIIILAPARGLRLLSFQPCF